MSAPFLFLNIFLVFTLIFLQYPSAAIRYGIPFPFNNKYSFIFSGILFFGSLLYITICRKDIRWTAVRKPMTELLTVFLLGYCIIWWRTGHIQKDLIIPILYGLLFSTVLYFFYRDKENKRDWGFTSHGFKASLNFLMLPTLMLAAVIIIATFYVGTRFRLSNTAVSLLTYPFSAFAQLILLMVFPIQRLKKLTSSRASVVITTSALFALVHWPNPMLVLSCFFVMIIWSAAYLRSPNIYPVSLSMGVLASLFIQLLPLHLTLHAEIGQSFMTKRLNELNPETVVKELEYDLFPNSAKPESRTNDAVFRRVYETMLDPSPASENFNTWIFLAGLFGQNNALHGFVRSLEFQSTCLNLESTEIAPKSDIRGYVYILDQDSDNFFIKGRATNLQKDEPLDSIIVMMNGKMILYFKKNRVAFPENDCPVLDRLSFYFPIHKKSLGLSTINDLRFFGISSDRIPTELFFHRAKPENGNHMPGNADFDGFMMHVYNACLNRCPDMEGNFYYIFRLLNGSIHCDELIKSFFGSKEFKERNPGDDHFAAALFRLIKDERLSNDDQRFFSTLKTSGLNKKKALNTFIGMSAFVNMCNRYGVHATSGRT